MCLVASVKNAPTTTLLVLKKTILLLQIVAVIPKIMNFIVNIVLN